MLDPCDLMDYLLQCTKVKSESEVAQSCRTLLDPMDCSLPGSSVHEIFQTRVLEWGATAFSRIKARWVDFLVPRGDGPKTFLPSWVWPLGVYSRWRTGPWAPIIPDSASRIWAPVWSQVYQVAPWGWPPRRQRAFSPFLLTDQLPRTGGAGLSLQAVGWRTQVCMSASCPPPPSQGGSP